MPKLTESQRLARNARQKKWADRNREYMRTYSKKYRKDNREKLVSGCRKYWKDNREELRDKSKLRYLENKEKILAASKDYIKKNREAVSLRRKKHYHKNKVKLNAENREYYSKNKARLLADQIRRDHARYHSEPLYKLKIVLRKRIQSAIKWSGVRKSEKTVSLVGCDIPFLKSHLESLFSPGMTWENHGNKGWHIDHIRPCASFNLSDVAEQRKCFHYTNLQPLWALDNMSKGSKFTFEIEVDSGQQLVAI